MTRVLDDIQTSHLIPQSVRIKFLHTTTRIWLHIHHCPVPIMDIYGHVGWVSCGVRDVLMWGDGVRVVYCSADVGLPHLTLTGKRCGWSRVGWRGLRLGRGAGGVGWGGVG